MCSTIGTRRTHGAMTRVTLGKLFGTSFARTPASRRRHEHRPCRTAYPRLLRVLRSALMRIDARRPAAPVALGIACALILTLAPSALAAQPQHKLPWEGPGVRVKPGSIVVTFASGTSPSENASDPRPRRRPTSPRGARSGSTSSSCRPPSTLSRRSAGTRPTRAWSAAELDRYRRPHRDHRRSRSSMTQWGLRNHRATASDHRVRVRQLRSSARGTNDADVDADQAWDLNDARRRRRGRGPRHGRRHRPPGSRELDVGQRPASRAGLWGVDDDGNGRVDDINGWDFRAERPGPVTREPTSAASHGTHVAGIVAAQRNDAVGIAGGLRSVPASWRCVSTSRSVRRSMRSSTPSRTDADVINMSFASGVWSPAERAAIRAAGQAGVARRSSSAGNSSIDNDIPFYVGRSFAPAFPASYTLPTILSVAASNHHNQYALVTECVMANGSRAADLCLHQLGEGLGRPRRARRRHREHGRSRGRRGRRHRLSGLGRDLDGRPARRRDRRRRDARASDLRSRRSQERPDELGQPPCGPQR